MDTARLVLDYIDVLKWPVVVGGILVVFRGRLFDLVGRLSRLDAAGVSATFDKTVEEAEEVLEDQPETEKTEPLREMVSVKPYVFGASAAIGHPFVDGAPVMVDLSEAPEAEAKRVIDFLTGLVYGRGTFEQLTTKTFLVTPGTTREH